MSIQEKAFPHGQLRDEYNGMTLRDYFAAKALQGIMVDPMMTMSADKIADWAYEMADAMLEARK
jgi:hypothetical protein